MRESTLADLGEQAVSPVSADGEERREFFAIVKEVTFGGSGELGWCESSGDAAHQQVAVVDHVARAVLPSRVFAFPLAGEILVGDAEALAI